MIFTKSIFFCHFSGKSVLDHLRQKLLQSRVFRMIEKFFRRVFLFDPAFIHKQHSRTDFPAKPISWVTTTIVIPSWARSRITLKTSPTISGSSALVGSSNRHDIRMHAQRANDGDSLFLTAGQLCRISVCFFCKADTCQQLHRFFFRFRLGLF